MSADVRTYFLKPPHGGRVFPAVVPFCRRGLFWRDRRARLAALPPSGLARPGGRTALEAGRLLLRLFTLQLLHGIFLPPLRAAQAGGALPQLFLQAAHAPPQPDAHHPPPDARRPGGQLRRELLPHLKERAEGGLVLPLVYVRHLCRNSDAVLRPAAVARAFLRGLCHRLRLAGLLAVHLRDLSRHRALVV